MGGYGALAFASHLRMTDTLAFSPQFHIGMDFDRRWAGRLQFFDWSHRLTPSRDCKHVIVYDPDNLDARHVKCYAERLNHLKEIALPGSGHSSVEWISAQGKLKAFACAFFLKGRIIDVGQSVSKGHLLSRLTGQLLNWRYP